jgi:hypothetical protein
MDDDEDRYPWWVSAPVIFTGSLALWAWAYALVKLILWLL